MKRTETTDRDGWRRWTLRLAAGLSPALPGDEAAAAEHLRAAIVDTDAHLLPVVVGALRRLNLLDRVPADARAALVRRQFETTALVLRQEVWLQRFVREVLPAGCPVLLLKGWAFHGTLYGEDETRAGGDIDLLFRPADYERVCALLERTAEPVELYRGRPYSCRTRYERGFWIDGDHRLCIEPHVQIAGPGFVQADHEALWARSVPHPLFHDARVRMPAPEDALLHLAAHALANQNCTPHALVDACRIARLWKPDLDVVRARAAEWGIGPAVQVFLRRLTEVFALPLPGVAAPTGVRAWLGARCLPVDRRTNDTKRAAFRSRQVLALGLRDRPFDALPFLARYVHLRALDLFAPPPPAPVRTAGAPLAGAADRYALYRGLSMYPTFRDRDLVVVEPLGGALPHAGDVIYFDSSVRGCRVIHRVVRVRADTVQTQGDSNDRPDACEPDARAIVGRVVAVCRPAGERRVVNGWCGVWLGRVVRLRNATARAVAPYRRRASFAVAGAEKRT